MTSSNLSSSDDDSRKLLNFSIEHILNKAGNQEPPTKTEQETGDLTTGSLSYIPFPWLHCTRYCPPKIPRNQRRDAPQKRQLGRHPRIPFTTHQLTVLENKFKKSPYLSSQEVKELSKNLDLADIRVKIWFQNRRARERREKLLLREDRNNERNLSLVVGVPTIAPSSPHILPRISTVKDINKRIAYDSLPSTETRSVDDFL